MRSTVIDITVQLLHETAAAVRVTDSTPDKGVWLPRSQIEIDHGNKPGLAIVTLPEWLAIEKGLV